MEIHSSVAMSSFCVLLVKLCRRYLMKNLFLHAFGVAGLRSCFSFFLNKMDKGCLGQSPDACILKKQTTSSRLFSTGRSIHSAFDEEMQLTAVAPPVIDPDGKGLLHHCFQIGHRCEMFLTEAMSLVSQLSSMLLRNSIISSPTHYFV